MIRPPEPSAPPAPGEFDAGFLIGLLVGEGHFGGDGRQPQITLRMHERHEKLFRWLEASFPAGRLYGPYHHGGRAYFQWMARGTFLRELLVPLIAARRAWLDDYVAARFDAMCERYGLSARGPVLSSPGPRDCIRGRVEPWDASSPSPTRRAGSARPPPPSTWRPAWPPPSAGCWRSTPTPRAT